MKGPDNSSYMKIIEKNTKLLSLNDVDSGNIVVNFSGEFLTGDNTKDVLAGLCSCEIVVCNQQC